MDEKSKLDVKNAIVCVKKLLLRECYLGVCSFHKDA